MPLRPCAHPGCANPASTTGKGRCTEHARRNDKAINRAGRAVYGTKRWKLTRRRKLFLTPLCEKPGCSEIATDVHHREGVQANPYALDGLESLCHSHHSQETRAEQMRAA